ncbi:hypothetical protein Poly41_25790 [Novipirellula artificiosorum]|uniref:Uncharacterized protein n=1 Tax=Novipirellula artificiosorum TaxID=2528016 RepID=A0A5C6DR20_9BACT|nr:hypothetical protein Poly41_25790 [Novipirellula artificiosorum]
MLVVPELRSQIARPLNSHTAHDKEGIYAAPAACATLLPAYMIAPG